MSKVVGEGATTLGAPAAGLHSDFQDSDRINSHCFKPHGVCRVLETKGIIMNPVSVPTDSCAVILRPLEGASTWGFGETESHRRTGVGDLCTKEETPEMPAPACCVEPGWAGPWPEPSPAGRPTPHHAKEAGTLLWSLWPHIASRCPSGVGGSCSSSSSGDSLADH